MGTIGRKGRRETDWHGILQVEDVDIGLGFIGGLVMSIGAHFTHQTTSLYHACFRPSEILA